MSAGRTIIGVEFQEASPSGEYLRPEIGQHVWLRYYPGQPGTVHASTTRPDCNPSNIAGGIVRRCFSPNRSSFYILQVEVIVDFPR